MTSPIQVRFDLNQWLREGPMRKRRRQQRKCSHVDRVPTTENGTFEVHVVTLFTSPPGTHAWICSACGVQAHKAQVDLILQQAMEQTERDIRTVMKDVGDDPDVPLHVRWKEPDRGLMG